jgi:hypothetical protein
MLSSAPSPGAPGQLLESRADVIKTRQRLAYSTGILITALLAGGGGDIVLPDDGEAAKVEILNGGEQFGPTGAEIPDKV